MKSDVKFLLFFYLNKIKIQLQKNEPVFHHRAKNEKKGAEIPIRSPQSQNTNRIQRINR